MNTRSLLRKSSSVLLGRVIEPFSGRRELWERHDTRLQKTLPLQAALELIEHRWASVDDENSEQPTFIFSAGWRSGSTLVQRLLVSGGDLLIWGEPYTLGDHLGRMAESLLSFSAVYPPEEFFLKHHEGVSLSGIQEKWIAHLYPDPLDLKKAHRVFLQTLLAAPAARRGFTRWGFKECKYGIEHAFYLKWLFPNSKFLFVYRNPLHMWRSFRLFGAYMRWPDDPVFTAKGFGELWKRLMEGFLEHCEEVDGIMVKYEDLAGGKLEAEKLAAFVGVRCDPKILNRTVTGRGKRALEAVPPMERRILAKAVEPLASKMGYTIIGDD